MMYQAFPMRHSALVKYTGGVDEQKDNRPGQACAQEGLELKECGGCGYYYYCDAKMTWKGKNHKKDRKVLENPNMRMLLNLKAATEALPFAD
ncbi:hypothetical protein CaCOL14_011433 [Colletotrichum acutatum]